MEALAIGLITALASILFFSLLGNLILCVVVHGQLPYQTVRNYSYLILNLAISDILLAGSSIPFDIVQRLESPIFPFGGTMCKLLWPFQTVCSMASIFTVGALSYQRYRLVVKPFNGKVPRHRFFIMLAAIWFLPVFLAGLPYSFVLRFDGNTSQCKEEWRPVNKQEQLKLSFTTYLFIIQYVLPLGLIVWCNVQAILELKRYLKYRKRTSMISALSIEHHENTVKMLTVIMAVFALFWLPGQVMHFLLEFERDNEFILTYGLDIGYLFVFTNCVMNPLIFAYFSQCHKKFRALRRFTSSSINPTIACELGYSTFRRESETSRKGSLQNAHRRGSLPSSGGIKRIPLSRSLKRPSLPAVLQCESITDAQRKNLLETGKKTESPKKRNGSVLPRKKQLPVLPEIPKSHPPLPTQNTDIPEKIQTSEAQKHHPLYLASHKRLSFSIQKQDTSNNLSETKKELQQSTRINRCKEMQKYPQTEKRSLLIKKGDSPPGTQRVSHRGTQAEKCGEVDGGNRLMRNFLEIMKTMKEDVLRKYLDATRETVLK